MKLQEAETLLREALVASGYDASEAQIVTDHLMDCELRGLGYGGLARGLSIIERVTAQTEPRGVITVERETPVSASLDGGDEVGYLVAQRALELALNKAATSGVGVVGARNTWYTGMMSYYLEQAAAQGFVGLAAGSGAHIVAPAGSTQARFATNPVAFGFPADPHPVIWDIGTSNLMLAEVLLAHRLGQPLPEGTAFDAQGNPTTTPMDVLGGALTVWGGHKGSGLAVVVQMLGTLAGAATAPEGLTDCGFFLLLIDPAILTDPDAFRARVSQYAESVRQARPLDPAHPVRMPFDRSVEQRQRRRGEGVITIDDTTLDGLRAAAETRGDDHA